MSVIQKNTSDIRQNEQNEQTGQIGSQTLSGFLAGSKNGCITDEKLIEAIYDFLAVQDIRSFYNNGMISWKRDPVADAVGYFSPSFRRRHDPDNLRFPEFVAGGNDAVERAFAKDPKSDVPIKIFQRLSSSSLCFVKNEYDGKENVR